MGGGRTCPHGEVSMASSLHKADHNMDKYQTMIRCQDGMRVNAFILSSSDEVLTLITHYCDP